MPFELVFALAARDQLRDLEFDEDKKDLAKLKKVRICLRRIETDPKYSGLHSHKYNEKKGNNGEDVWESYVENKNPSAWRVFWHYGPDQREITILLITPHPKTKGKK